MQTFLNRKIFEWKKCCDFSIAQFAYGWNRAGARARDNGQSEWAREDATTRGEKFRIDAPPEGRNIPDPWHQGSRKTTPWTWQASRTRTCVRRRRCSLHLGTTIRVVIGGYPCATKDKAGDDVSVLPCNFSPIIGFTQENCHK